MEMHGRKEADFRSWLTGRMGNKGFFAESIESSTKSGIPDVHACIERAFWMELKVHDGDNPLIRKQQRVWGIRYTRRQGLVFFVVYSPAANNIRIYSNPIINVKQSGDKLAVLDEPLLTCRKLDITDVLRKLVNS